MASPAIGRPDLAGHLPGVSGLEQLLQIPLPFLRLDLVDLTPNPALERSRLDLPVDPDRHGSLGRLQTAQGKRERRHRIVRVVDENVFFAQPVSQLNDLEARSRPAKAPVALGPEDERL